MSLYELNRLSTPEMRANADVLWLDVSDAIQKLESLPHILMNFQVRLAHMEERAAPLPPLPPHRHHREPNILTVGEYPPLTGLPIPEQPAETQQSEHPPHPIAGEWLLCPICRQAAEMPQSEQSSSVATETAEETKPTWRPSRMWSYPVSPGGMNMQSVRRDILDWLSSIQIPGDVQEVEIGVTLTSKAATPPTGAASPIQQHNGHAGELRPYLRKPAAIIPSYLPVDELWRWNGEWVSIVDYKELLAAYDSLSSPSPVADWGMCDNCGHEHYYDGAGPACSTCDCDSNPSPVAEQREEGTPLWEREHYAIAGAMVTGNPQKCAICGFDLTHPLHIPEERDEGIAIEALRLIDAMDGPKDIKQLVKETLALIPSQRSGAEGSDV